MISKEEVSLRLGTRIRSLRNSKKWSIEELASHSGMDYSQLSRIERGKINTSVYHIYVLSKALNLHVGQIFDGVLSDFEDGRNQNTSEI